MSHENQTNNKIDMPPNAENLKLNIALKWEDDEDCYGYAIESFRSGHSDGRDKSKQLPRGEFPVAIRLDGVGVGKEFTFTLVNPGKGGRLNLKEESKNKK